MTTLRLPLGPRVAAPIAKWATVVASIPVLAAVLVALGPWAAGLRACVAMLLVVAAAAAHHRLGHWTLPPAGWVVVDDAGVRRTLGGRQAPLIDWSEPFGATLLASADGATLMIALTGARTMRLISVRVGEGEEGVRTRRLLARAQTAAVGYLELDPAAALAPAGAERLLAAIEERVPAALKRLLLSDAAGEPVVLDGGELRVGARRFDLGSPLEWRAWLFQELGPHTLSICSATWVRQADAEVVFVAPLPCDNPGPRGAKAGGAGWADPPPRELRHAVDAVFMLPLRRALERAPRAARVSSLPSIREHGRA